MSKPLLTANLLAEFIEQCKHLEDYMEEYTIKTKDSIEAMHYGRALSHLWEARREMEKVIEENPDYSK